jgi:hypothetical protein
MAEETITFVGMVEKLAHTVARLEATVLDLSARVERLEGEVGSRDPDPDIGLP